MANLDVSGAVSWSTDPGAYKATHLGTAAGTAVIYPFPAFLSHIQINTRAASGVIVIYDSNGTSTNVIGSITLGSQTFSDPVPYIYKAATRTGLTISNTANLDLTVLALP